MEETFTEQGEDITKYRNLVWEFQEGFLVEGWKCEQELARWKVRIPS